MKKVDILKILRFSCLIFVFFFFIMIFIGKKVTNHISYDDYISNTDYFITSTESMYRHYSRLKGFFINDSLISNIDDLFDKSDYVFKIIVQNKPLIYGNSLINNAKVLKIYKNDSNHSIYEGNDIKIYDLVNLISNEYIDYSGGMTPLTLGDKYVVFVKKTPNPSVKNTFVFSSVEYGHFNISRQSNLLFGYENGSLTMKEIMKYDYIYSDCNNKDMICEKQQNKYIKLKEELIQKINENV